MPVIIYVDGQALSGSDQAVLLEGRVLVPVRVLMESLGATVHWDPELRTVTVTRNTGASMKLWLDNRLFSYSDATSVTYDVCDVAPRVIDDRTYVPLRVVAESLGISISWDDSERRVMVDTARAVAPKPYYNLSIFGVNDGQRITDMQDLALSYGSDSPPAGASQTRYYFLYPISGTGKIVAMSSSADGAAQWLPDLAFNGSLGILAATVLDANGSFLMGTAVQVHLELTPKVELIGLEAGQLMTGEIQMNMESNFAASGVEYEFTQLSTGSSTRSRHSDPDGAYTHYPPAGQTGRIGICAIAFDSLGNTHRSEQVIILAQVPEVDNTPYVRLHNFAVADVGKVPVTLAISRNFDVDSTQYWVLSPRQNQEIMLMEVPWGDYRWFPGPEMAGEWDVFVRVVATDGQIYTSNSIRVIVPYMPSIVLQGAGPGQVVTGDLELSSLANVPLVSVEYRIRNPSMGSYEVIGVVADSSDEVVFEPGSEHEGERRLQAIGTTEDGQTIIDEFSVSVYLGELFSSQPLTSREDFISIITPLALQSQRQSGMSAALQVAQAILETGWGQSLPVDRYTGLFSYNLFGIKGRGSAGSVICRTFEEYYGTMYSIDDYFRAYFSVQESWADHKDLLLLAGRYQPFRDVMFNSTRGAYALRRCGYATASTYPDVLKDIIEQYGLDALDWQPI